MNDFPNLNYVKTMYLIAHVFVNLIWYPGLAQNDSFSNIGTETNIHLTFYQSDSINELKATVTTSLDGDTKPLNDVSVGFYNINGTEEFLLGNIRTNENGEAVLILTKSTEFSRNSEENITFLVKFNGNEKYSFATAEISVREVEMEISFVEIDSVKTIVATAHEIGVGGEMTPLENMDVYFYVPRSFSMLNIGEEWFEEGQCNIDFPVTLPGDSLGNLSIIARIEDSDIYGNVETQAIKDWGTPLLPVIVEKRRGLGDTDAPLWMVYTLIILLSAVWFHYLYILYTIYLIKKEGEKVN